MATVSKDFTALGLGNLLFVRHLESFTYAIAGTFVGTVYLARSEDGGKTHERVAGPFTTTLSATTYKHEGKDQGTAYYMFICTAFTSGTIETDLVDVTAAVNQFVNSEGNTVLAINEDGIAVTGTASVSGATTLTGAVTAASTLDVTGVTTATGGLQVVSGSATSAVILSASKSQNSQTRAILSNGNAGASAYARFTVASDAGDLNIDANSVAAGAVAEIVADATFTVGLNVRALAGAAKLQAGAFTGVSVSATTGIAACAQGVTTKVAVTDTANPPTQAELVTAFGVCATNGAGFIGVLNDAAGGTNVYFVYSDGTNYFYVLGTVGA